MRWPNTRRRNKRSERRQLGFVRYDLREMMLNRPELQANKPVSLRVCEVCSRASKTPVPS